MMSSDSDAVFELEAQLDEDPVSSAAALLLLLLSVLLIAASPALVVIAYRAAF